jgi:hypothetical protein
MAAVAAEGSTVWGLDPVLELLVEPFDCVGGARTFPLVDSLEVCRAAMLLDRALLPFAIPKRPGCMGLFLSFVSAPPPPGEARIGHRFGQQRIAFADRFRVNTCVGEWRLTSERRRYYVSLLRDAAGNRRCAQGGSPEPCRRPHCPAQAGWPHRTARREALESVLKGLIKYHQAP